MSVFDDRFARLNISNSGLIHGATDTASAVLSRIFHILAQRPEVQDRLRKEIIEARAKDGDLAYNEILALPYLDAAIRETLRL